MLEFFKPWRRKVGVLTLVMALMFMALWMRSIGYWEDLTMPWGKGNQYLMHAGVCNGKVYYCRTEFHPPNFLFGATLPNQPSSWYYRCAVPFNTDISGTVDDANWDWRAGLVNLGPGPDVTHEPAVENLIWAIPDWLIILPLTIVSAYLLVSKPRKTSHGPATEPPLEKLSN